MFSSVRSVPEVIHGRYRLIRALGEGGMATTYLAEDLVMGRQIALKVMSEMTPELADLLRAEFAILRELIHPHLARAQDFGRFWDGESQRLFYTATLVDGLPLSHHCVGRTWDEVAPAVVDTLSALRFLHGLELVHGDVHPDNVLIDRSGHATLVDLGCSRPFGTAAVVSGRPGFVAPEVLEGLPVDGRADLFAIGVVIGSLGDVLQDGLPERIRSCSRRLREADRRHRPAEAAEVLEELGVDLPELIGARGHRNALRGRDEELRCFREALESVEAGVQGIRVLAVEGPDGSGRSRLLLEMKWQAQERLHVIEGDPTQTEAVAAMFSRALSKPGLSVGLEAVLAYRDELASERHDPLVMVIDDVHDLDEGQSALLQGVLRSTSTDGRLLLVCAGRQLPTPQCPGVRKLALGPLEALDLLPMVGDELPPERLEALMEATAGLPGLVVAVLNQLRTGQITTDDLGRAVHPRPEVVQDRVWALDADSRRAVWLIALARFDLSIETLVGLGVTEEVVASLTATGWIRREGDALRLARTLETEAVRAAVDTTSRTSIHQDLVRWLKARPDGQKAALIAHLAESGREEEAVACLGEAREELRRSPTSTTLAALDAILRGDFRPEIILEAAALEERAGRPDRALARIEALLKGSPADRYVQAGRLLAASVHLKLGDAGRALTELDRLIVLGEGGGRAADLRARASLKLGRYREALDEAEGALRHDSEPAATSALHLDAGMAASYLGDRGRAREHLLRARETSTGIDDPHHQVRCLAYQALDELRGGNLTEAARGFRAALALARAMELNDQVASAALNLGTVEHQMGDLGRAYRSYERALKFAVALGAVSVETTARHNLATLFLDVGLTARSKAAADGAEAAARAAGAQLLIAENLALRGQIALLEGAAEEATRALAEARRLFGELRGAQRELVETDLHDARCDLALSNPAGALAKVERCLRALDRLEAVDLRARALTLRGELQLLLGEAEEALLSFEEARELARKGPIRLVEAQIVAQLAQVHAEGGSAFLARQHRLRAQELLETIAAGLPAEWCDAFRSRYALGLEVPEPYEEPPPRQREVRLRRLLELSTMLSASLDVCEVLRRTMDAAIEVTGAERGFVILVEGGDLEVAVARNIDRERIGRSHLKYSRTVASEAIRSGEPIVTTDAMADERFQGNRSVHAMRLRSIVCVPIRGPESVLGALYVDNRFQPGRFTRQDTDLLLAFANHVAVALINARLHDSLARKTQELEERTVELEAQKTRVEALLAEKSERIDELSDQLSAKQEVLEHRYDYSQIIGRSPAMSALLRLLDRIIPTSTSVLIQGESGTGKELVARAIHFNGPRRQGPFVSLNCGAMPEALLESELFGHVRGAFTDAREDRRGLLLSAQGGTIFLDEVGEMPPSMQVKLLRALEERRIRPVGGTREASIDIRLICATNRDLLEEIGRGAFREDLYYRLAVVGVTLPPLRDRPTDVPLLADHILDRVAREHGIMRRPLSPSALRALVAHDWPGNVRQLENALTKATLLVRGQTIAARDLELPAPRRANHGAPANDRSPASREAFQRTESEEIAHLLAAHRWNISKTARALGMSRTTLYTKMRLHGLSR